jgi:uncharacterized protein Yka (UPF0111/DUF47 family)
VKFLFSLMQFALTHAQNPEEPAPNLRRERIACGVDELDLDDATAGARMVGTSCQLPGAAKIIERMVADMRVMAAPALVDKSEGFRERLDKLLAALPKAENDLLEPAAISGITQVDHDAGDSLHKLVMDLHKRLNALQAELAEETIDGAAVYHIEDADRALVTTFMAGLNRTAKLKFNHPGLATTATRADGRLIIQNDIGTTDAHVIVIHVADLSVSVTYTDVHPERLAFFQALLKPRGVKWQTGSPSMLAAGMPFYLATGVYEATDADSCRAYLEYLGSSLVFLIDWNRARKQLRGFLRGVDRVAVLRWAADNEIGHRGFLELGGARLINDVIEATAGSSMHFGDRLCDVLGDAETIEFTHFVFRAATDGLLAGQSHGFIQDRIRFALARHFTNEERQLLRLALDHAGLIFEIACLVREGLHGDQDRARKRARRAQSYEHDADQLVSQTRAAVLRRPEYSLFRALMEAADDAADGLEDAAFFLDVDALEGKPLALLRSLGDLLVEAAQEWIKALGDGEQIGRVAGREETEDFLAAFDRLAALEHQADDAERALTAEAIRHAKDFRQLHLYTAIGSRLEAASDALRHASLILHAHVLKDIIDG